MLIYVPLPTWPLWLAHFAATETCLIACVTGALAFSLASTPTERGLAVIGIAAGLLPALWVAPLYLREGVRFSPLSWLGWEHAAAVDIRRDVEVAPGLLADIYGGVGGSPRPAIVIVHGGSWRAGDKGDAPHVSIALASAGYVVFDIRYRLAPEYPFPAGLSDVKCAVGGIRENAAAFGVDGGRIALLGRSAGANLALVAAYSGEFAKSCAGDTSVAAVISIYGPTDLAWSHDHPFVPDVVDGTAAIEVYLGGAPTEKEEQYRQASPQSWLDAPVPPTLLIHGTGERCVRPENMEKLASALLLRGISPRVLRIPLADHGFDIRRGGLGEQLSRSVILDFLAQHLQ